MSEPTLLTLGVFPPKGWVYREPALGWQNEDPLNGEGFEHAVLMIQTVRAQNPASNLDPSYGACAKALVQFTCARLQYDPRWCGLPPLEQQEIWNKTQSARRGCASCGRR